MKRWFKSLYYGTDSQISSTGFNGLAVCYCNTHWAGSDVDSAQPINIKDVTVPMLICIQSYFIT